MSAVAGVLSGRSFRLPPVVSSGQQTIALPQPSDWTDHGVVIAAGADGEWDEHREGAYNSPNNIVEDDDGILYAFYIGADGLRADGGPANRKLGVATSTDGQAWTKHASNPLISYNPAGAGAGVNEDEEGVFSSGVAIKPDGSWHAVWGGLSAISSDAVEINIHYSTASDGIAWSPNTEPGNQIIGHDETAFAGNASGGDDETFPGDLFWDEVSGEFQLYYVTKEAPQYDIYHVHGADLETLSAANSSTAVDDNPKAGDLWRSAKLIDRGNDNIDLFASVQNDGSPRGQLYRLPITSRNFANPGAPVSFYDFTTQDGINNTVYATIFASRSLEKWIMLYREDNTDDIKCKTAPLTFEGGGDGGSLTLLGSWPLDETSGNTFADATGTNGATLTVPAWTIATHQHDRRSMRADQVTSGYDATHTKVGGGGAAALEVSNGGPAIPMITAYQLAEVSFVIWTCPLSEQRGLQHWNTSAPGYGSEIIAGAFNRASPGAGHWLIERRLSGSSRYYTFSVHDGSSWTTVGGGVANALAPIEVANRLVATFGAAGAQFWVDDNLIGTVAGYTGGWGTLAEPITLGCDPDFDHANDRRPYWGRLEHARVYSGQMASADVAALPAATSSLLWKYPADFDSATAIDLADHSGSSTPVQDAIEAAHTAGVYVWQQETDLAEYGDPYDAAGNDCSNKMRQNCKGLVGCRMTRPAHPTTIGNFDRWFEFGSSDSGASGLLTGAYSGKLVGCVFDANAFESGYRIDGPAPNGNDIQQAHILRFKTHGFTCTVDIDACTFQDGTSDALSCYRGARITPTSCRFKAIFRGGIVQNENNVQIQPMRCELSEFGPHDRNGCGFDIEPFGQTEANDVKFYDVWLDSDFDDHGEGRTNPSIYRYTNVHGQGGSINIAPSGTSNDFPVQEWSAYYCTLPYHHHYGNFPPAWFKGLATAESSGNVGLRFDHTIFVASGLPYRFHEFGITTPDDTTEFEIFVQNSSGVPDGPRLMSFKECELRARDLPAGIAISLVNFFTIQALTTAESVELDGFKIDAAFDDTPMEMGGVTVRHRNVTHERTGSSTPWTGAGAEVAI